jgi:hypothetical protein
MIVARTISTVARRTTKVVWILFEAAVADLALIHSPSIRTEIANGALCRRCFWYGIKASMNFNGIGHCDVIEL